MSYSYSVVTVPAYVSWKCRKCGRVNLSDGHFVVTSLKDRDRFYESAKTIAENEERFSKIGWKNQVFPLIIDVAANAAGVRDYFIPAEAYGTSCGAKPPWAKRLRQLWIGLIRIMIGFSALCTPMLFFPSLWDEEGFHLPQGFAAFWGPVVLTIVMLLVLLYFVDKIFCRLAIKRSFPNYPLVIGSLNPTLIDWAERWHKIIPNPYEAVNLAAGAIRREDLATKRWDSFVCDPAIDENALSVKPKSLMATSAQEDIQYVVVDTVDE